MTTMVNLLRSRNSAITCTHFAAQPPCVTVHPRPAHEALPTNFSPVPRPKKLTDVRTSTQPHKQHNKAVFCPRTIAGESRARCCAARQTSWRHQHLGIMNCDEGRKSQETPSWSRSVKTKGPESLVQHPRHRKFSSKKSARERGVKKKISKLSICLCRTLHAHELSDKDY